MHPLGFYVYQLVDPRSALPFYVGKGQHDRAWRHEKEVRAGRIGGNARKAQVIADVIAAGLCVDVQIVAEYDLESDALDHEFRLVDSQPTLTNIMPGGIGKARTPEQIARCQRIRRMKLKALRRRESQDALVRQTAQKRASFIRIRGAERHQDEIEAWINGLKNRRSLLRMSGPRRSGKRAKADLAAFRASKPT
jgi:hypothetical protein